MKETEFQAWAEQLARQHRFTLGRELYKNTYYATGSFRNLIVEADWRGQPAVLKLYDDQRVTDEPEALRRFHQTHRQHELTAPQYFAGQSVSATRGWLVMERLPAEAKPFRSPLSAGDRDEFLTIYKDYRSSWPTAPDRPLRFGERLDRR